MFWVTSLLRGHVTLLSLCVFSYAYATVIKLDSVYIFLIEVHRALPRGDIIMWSPDFGKSQYLQL